jgi:hypothetical protein
MAVKIRCSVCRKTVEASPRAKGRQKVCCAECRKERDRLLARKRRRAAVTRFRAEEVERKRAQRERQRAALTAELESASWQEAEKCHAPGSDDNRRNLFMKIARSVDRDLQMSRARLQQAIRQMGLEPAAQGARPGP